MSRMIAVASAALWLIPAPSLQAQGRPTRPPRPAPRGNQSVRFDPPYALWLSDGTRMVKVSGTVRDPFAAEAEKIIVDPRLAVFYSWNGRLPDGAGQPARPAPGVRPSRSRGRRRDPDPPDGAVPRRPGPVRGRRASGIYFLMTLTKNLKADTAFGARVHKCILTPQSKAGDQILCWLSPAGEWRGVVHGSGEATGIRMTEFRRIIGGPPKRVRWAMVVGDINHGVWVASSFSAVRNAGVRRLCEANYPKVSNITCWWGANGKAKLFPFDATSSYHMLLVQDRAPKALDPPGAAPGPPAGPPAPVAKPDPPAATPPATGGKATWPFAAKIPTGFRLAHKVTAEKHDVWVLEGPVAEGVRDVLLAIRAQPGAKPLTPISAAIWAAGSAAGYLPGGTGLKAGSGGWAQVTAKIEMRTGWRAPQTALGGGSPPSSKVTTEAKGGQPARQIKVSATEYRSRDDDFVVAGATRANSTAYRAIGNKVDILARALEAELSRGAKPPSTNPPGTTPPTTTVPKPNPKPSPERRAASQFRLAEAYLKSGLTSRARDVLKRITEDFPNTKAATAAAKRLKVLEEPK